MLLKESFVVNVSDSIEYCKSEDKGEYFFYVGTWKYRFSIRTWQGKLEYISIYLEDVFIESKSFSPKSIYKIKIEIDLERELKIGIFFLLK